MRPLLAIVVSEGVEPARVAETALRCVGDAFAGIAELRYLATEEDLRDFQAGHMVVYRKPVRHASDELAYRTSEGEEVLLKQQTLFKEDNGDDQGEAANSPQGER